MSVELPWLPLIQEKFIAAIRNKTGGEKDAHNCKLDLFIQTWGNTGIGLNQWGGQSLTDAYTTVVMDSDSDWCGVFFDNTLAYIIDKPNDIFYEDLKNRQMKPVWEHQDYIN